MPRTYLDPEANEARDLYNSLYYKVRYNTDKLFSPNEAKEGLELLYGDEEKREKNKSSEVNNFHLRSIFLWWVLGNYNISMIDLKNLDEKTIEIYKNEFFDFLKKNPVSGADSPALYGDIFGKAMAKVRDTALFDKAEKDSYKRFYDMINGNPLFITAMLIDAFEMTFVPEFSGNKKFLEAFENQSKIKLNDANGGIIGICNFGYIAESVLNTEISLANRAFYKIYLEKMLLPRLTGIKTGEFINTRKLLVISNEANKVDRLIKSLGDINLSDEDYSYLINMSFDDIRVEKPELYNKVAEILTSKIGRYTDMSGIKPYSKIELPAAIRRAGEIEDADQHEKELNALKQLEELNDRMIKQMEENAPKAKAYRNELQTLISKLPDKFNGLDENVGEKLPFLKEEMLEKNLKSQFFDVINNKGYKKHYDDINKAFDEIFGPLMKSQNSLADSSIDKLHFNFYDAFFIETYENGKIKRQRPVDIFVNTRDTIDNKNKEIAVKAILLGVLKRNDVRLVYKPVVYLSDGYIANDEELMVVTHKGPLYSGEKVEELNEEEYWAKSKSKADSHRKIREQLINEKRETFRKSEEDRKKRADKRAKEAEEEDAKRRIRAGKKELSPDEFKNQLIANGWDPKKDAVILNAVSECYIMCRLSNGNVADIQDVVDQLANKKIDIEKPNTQKGIFVDNIIKGVRKSMKSTGDTVVNVRLNKHIDTLTDYYKSREEARQIELMDNTVKAVVSSMLRCGWSEEKIEIVKNIYKSLANKEGSFNADLKKAWDEYQSSDFVKDVKLVRNYKGKSYVTLGTPDEKMLENALKKMSEAIGKIPENDRTDAQKQVILDYNSFIKEKKYVVEAKKLFHGRGHISLAAFKAVYMMKDVLENDPGYNQFFDEYKNKVCKAFSTVKLGDKYLQYTISDHMLRSVRKSVEKAPESKLKQNALTEIDSQLKWFKKYIKYESYRDAIMGMNKQTFENCKSIAETLGKEKDPSEHFSEFVKNLKTFSSCWKDCSDAQSSYDNSISISKRILFPTIVSLEETAKKYLDNNKVTNDKTVAVLSVLNIINPAAGKEYEKYVKIQKEPEKKAVAEEKKPVKKAADKPVVEKKAADKPVVEKKAADKPVKIDKQKKQEKVSFPGENEKNGRKVKVWGHEPAVLAYHLIWLDKINKALFPEAYESDEMMQAISKFVSGDNFDSFNYHQVDSFELSSGNVIIGANNDVSVSKKVKDKNIEEARALLWDLNQFYEYNVIQPAGVGEVCKKLAFLTSKNNPQNLLLMAGESRFGKKLLDIITAEPNVGIDMAQTKELSNNPGLKQSIIDTKISCLNKLVQETEIIGKQHKGTFNTNDIDRKKIIDTNKALLHNYRKLDAASKNNDKKIVNKILGNTEDEYLKTMVDTIIPEENRALAEGLPYDIAHLFSCIAGMIKMVDKLPLYLFIGASAKDNINEDSAIKYKNKFKHGFIDEVQKRFETAKKDTTPENIFSLIEFVINNQNKAVYNVIDHIFLKPYLASIKELGIRIRKEKKDYKAAEAIYNNRDNRAKALIDCWDKQDDFSKSVMEEFWSLLDTKGYNDANVVIKDLIAEKEAVFDELYNEIFLNRQEMGKNYLTAISDGTYGNLENIGEKKDIIVKKLAVQLAMAARPDLVKKLDTLDELIEMGNNRYHGNVTEEDVEGFKTKLNDPEKSIYYKAIKNRNEQDEDTKDVRLVVENFSDKDRIAVVISNDGKNNIISKKRNAMTRENNMLKRVIDISNKYTKFYDWLRLDDPNMVTRMSQDNAYKEMVEALKALKDISPYMTFDTIRLRIVNLNMKVNNYKTVLQQKGNNLTQQEKDIKANMVEISEELPRTFESVPSIQDVLKGNNNVPIFDHTIAIYEDLRKTRVGTEKVKDYLKQANYLTDAIQIAKEGAQKALKDLKADKSGNSWQFEEMKRALQRVTKLTENSTPAEVIDAIRGVDNSAKLYAEKSDRQVHPFGEPSRTTLARSLSSFASGLNWKKDVDDPSRGTVEAHLTNYPYWGNPCVSVREQIIQLKMDDLDTMKNRSVYSKKWVHDFFYRNTNVVSKLADLLDPAAPQANAQAANAQAANAQAANAQAANAQAANANPHIPIEELKNRRYGEDKRADKKLLADKLRELAKLTKNDTISKVRNTLDELRIVTTGVYKTNKKALARNGNDEINASNIVKVVNKMIKEINKLEISRYEMNKTADEMANDRVKDYNKVNIVKKDSFKRGDAVEKKPVLRGRR